MNKHLLPYFFFLIVFASIPIHSHGWQSTDPDELFKQARDRAFEQNDYPGAIKLALQALELAPEYLDVKEFLGRVYFWSDQYDNAEKILTQVLSEDPARNYSRESLIDIYLSKNENEIALELSNEGVSNDPSNVRFLLRKAFAHENLREKNLAIQTFQEILAIEPNNSLVLSKLEEYDEFVEKWMASLGTDISFFKEDLDNWAETRLDIIRKTSIGAFGGNLKYGSRFGLNDQQLEVYAYPVLGPKMYGYVSVGASSNTFYPEFHIVGSIYRALPNRFELELGYRNLNFELVNVNILTTTLAKYALKNRFIFRAFYTLAENNNSYTTLFSFRHLLKGADNFIEFSTGYGGNSGDFNSSNEIIGTDQAYQFGASYQMKFAQQFIASIGASYTFEEYQNGLERNRYNLGLNLSYRF